MPTSIIHANPGGGALSRQFRPMRGIHETRRRANVVVLRPNHFELDGNPAEMLPGFFNAPISAGALDTATAKIPRSMRVV